ncbi:hypothetical protein BDB00DRAFT_871496 [Zychaea mexicana]|uniref:uncharacterized protein n=1 Tax=Zychaea mexicana TaxID=64656 RepID=UPI0022FF0B11|nr:uncharacterized protein BDB00DRAFT_871496 [Zychaea mexicana]KAI9494407.1 hypothetical protein BDB00DRAFT_871496 [Zychaea mexicana]
MPFLFFRKSSRTVNSEISAEELVRQRQSVQEAQMAASSTLVRDPMRIGSVPDVLGSFVDPMGGRATYTISRDPTSKYMQVKW